MQSFRAKLSKNSSIKVPGQLSSAIAKITEGFSFAYLQEAFVSALLSIVQLSKTQKANPDASAISSTDDLASNEVWQAINHQVQVLRTEMKSSRKSVEDAAKNSIMSDARSSSSSFTGFGLGS